MSQEFQEVTKAIQHDKDNANPEGIDEGAKWPYKASEWSQFKALLWRSTLTAMRDPMLIQVRFALAIVRNRKFAF